MNTISTHAKLHPESPAWVRLGTTALLFFGVLGVFIVRTRLAETGNPPRLFAIFNIIVLLGSIAVLAFRVGTLKRTDWLLALILGVMLGATVRYTTFYPLVELPGQNLTGVVHGAAVAILFLAGASIMRQGGPVTCRATKSEWRRGLVSAGFGLLVGLPLAVLNVAAFSLMQNQPVNLVDPLMAAFRALQPGIVEEVAYRYALLGIVWFVMQKTWPERAVLIASLLSLLVHNYAHLDALLSDNLGFALAYGAVVGLVWGLPMTLLAVRRDLESAAAFHWIQDFLRFACGF